MAKREGKFPWLVDDQGNWSVRNDVYFQEARLAKDGRGSPLSATSNGKSIGPELGFGHVLGTFHDEQVLLINPPVSLYTSIDILDNLLVENVEGGINGVPAFFDECCRFSGQPGWAVR